jgi:hypothetical protein
MSKATGTARALGRLASILALVGIAVFMAGLFGAPKTFVFVGVGLIAVSLVGFFIEEFGVRT